MYSNFNSFVNNDLKMRTFDNLTIYLYFERILERS